MIYQFIYNKTRLIIQVVDMQELVWSSHKIPSLSRGIGVSNQ